MRRLLLLALLALTGCDDSTPMIDAGPLPEDAGPPPTQTEAPTLPSVAGTCPTFPTETGEVDFAPPGITARRVRIYVSDAAATSDGPLYFYWHGTGSQPREAEAGIGATLMQAILDAGGIVAAPFPDPENEGTFPWFLTTGTRTDDLTLADEIVACAEQELGIDETRVHSLGFSAGGLHTTQMGFRRSSYLASVAIYSGGLIFPRTPPRDDPNNFLPMLIFHGGPSDVVAVSFEETSANLWEELDDEGHLGIVCDHGGGHSIPFAAAASLQLFFETHPFGTYPSPWVDGLPEGFYAPCSLEP